MLKLVNVSLFAACTYKPSSSTPHANYGLPLVKFTKPKVDSSY